MTNKHCKKWATILKRNQLLIVVFLGILCSCAQTSQKADSAVNTAGAKDSLAATLVSDSGKVIFSDRGYYEDLNYSLVVKSMFIVPDSTDQDSSYYFEGNYLFLTSRKKNTVDSIRLDEPCSYGDRIIIENETTHFEFQTPFFAITTPACSDQHNSQFFEIKNDTLVKRFEIFNYISTEWKRKDKNTLSGQVPGRDEVVAATQFYPITINLNDDSETMVMPENQEIGFPSEALESFTGFRISAGNVKTTYRVKKGVHLLIDSLNRVTNMVRIVIKDTVIVYVPTSAIEGKVRINAAG
jgi:hypothetical protein